MGSLPRRLAAEVESRPVRWRRPDDYRSPVARGRSTPEQPGLAAGPEAVAPRFLGRRAGQGQRDILPRTDCNRRREETSSRPERTINQ